MPGLSSAAKMFARNSNMAQKVSGGLGSAARKVHGGSGPLIGSMSGLRSGTARQRAGTAMQIMADYPRRTMAGGAAGLGAMGAYGSARRRGSQNYPMY